VTVPIVRCGFGVRSSYAGRSATAQLAADWTIGVNGSVLRVRLSPATLLAGVKAAATVSLTWPTAASVATAPFCVAWVGMGMRDSFEEVTAFPAPVQSG
jgi:hypothetical protein